MVGWPRARQKGGRLVQRVCIIRQRAYYELPVRREAETLRDAGFEVDVICLGETGHSRVEVDNGVRLHRLPLQRRKGGVLGYLADYLSFFVLAAVKVTRLHLTHPYRVIQVNTMPDSLVFATLIPRLLGARVVLFMKEPTPELGASLYRSPLAPFLLRIVERLALRYAHLVFTVTKQLKDTYVARGARSGKIHVVLNGPDPRHLLGQHDAVPSDASRYTVICHGSVEERYGHDTIVKAAKLVKDEIPGIRVRITGDGSYVGEMLELIDRLGVGEYVDYLGWVDMPTLVEELRQADVGVVAQKSSPYSNLVHTNKMYEYIVMGIPVVLTRLASVQEYFGDDAVRYFEPDDPSSLAEAILDLHRSPEKGRALLENARKLYEAYSWEAQSQVFLDGYRRVLDRGAG